LAEELTEKVVGKETLLLPHEERNGYIFWGLVAAFIAIPELLAACSSWMKTHIPWPTISNLVGKDLEAKHHWVALVVVFVIVSVILHTLNHPSDEKIGGRSLRKNPEVVKPKPVKWGGFHYVVLVAVTGIAVGLIAAAAGADKNTLGYCIYVTLALLGVVVPSILAYWYHRALGVPTLFAAIALLDKHLPWVAGAAVALLVVLMFHLGFYPWPNYHFGTP
jgi:hypothetical protein